MFSGGCGHPPLSFRDQFANWSWESVFLRCKAPRRLWRQGIRIATGASALAMTRFSVAPSSIVKGERNIKATLSLTTPTPIERFYMAIHSLYNRFRNEQ